LLCIGGAEIQTASAQSTEVSIASLLFNDLERISASPENAAAILETLHQVDVSSVADRLFV
jgi:hypothetical protein